MDNVVPHASIAVVRCGNCVICDNRKLLTQGLCLVCYREYKDWGPGGWKEEFGEIIKRCRNNKKFAYMLYSSLKNVLAKEAFKERFGPFPL